MLASDHKRKDSMMATPYVTAERLKHLLDYNPETGDFFWKVQRRGKARIGTKAGTHARRGYWEISIDSHSYVAHRLAWMYVHGVMPSGVIDHINRNKLDNRISNLRDVTSYLNSKNTGLFSSNSSGVKGAYFHKKQGTWIAYIADLGERHHLGCYSTKEEAEAARQGAERIIFKIRGIKDLELY